MPPKLKERRLISTTQNRLRNPNWREADQLALCKHDQGIEQGCTKKQLQLRVSDQRRTLTRNLQISSLATI